MFDIFSAIQNSLPELSAAGLFFVFFFGTFLSEDAACLLAGSAAASGRISFAFALTSCFFGIFAGDILLFAAGRTFGTRIFANGLFSRFVSDRTLAKASIWLEKNGAAAVFITRFVSGLRLPTYLLAGALRTDFTKFALYFLLAAALWTPIVVGSTAFSQTFIFPKNTFLGLIAIAVTIRIALKYSSGRNRRLLIGKIKRIQNWEFWPIQIFYAPVVLYVFWLGVKHRGLAVFTAANPAIPAGGFKGESKDEIYRGLRSAREHLLLYTLIRNGTPIDEKLRQAWQFIEKYGLDYPLVLKPNAGERGKDVKTLRSADDLETAILAADCDMILQQFAPGKELSIFYYRYPGEERGHIFSITEKRFPLLTGDGISTIEQLILNDPRAVCLAERYFEQNASRLEHIPAYGETVKLVEIGTHSRGAIFLDGGWIKTEALETRIEEICRSFNGFYFGRFDIRCASIERLMHARNFKIIELNGVTSESTNIYDPRYTLIEAYRILFHQWRIAFEIGAENIKLGKGASRAGDLIRLACGLPAKTETGTIRHDGQLTSDH